MDDGKDDWNDQLRPRRPEIKHVLLIKPVDLDNEVNEALESELSERPHVPDTAHVFCVHSEQ